MGSRSGVGRKGHLGEASDGSTEASTIVPPQAGAEREPTGRRRFGAVIAAVPSAWLLLLLVVPLGLLIAWSFQAPTVGIIFKGQYSLDSYQLAFGTSQYWAVLWKTVFTAFAVAVISILLGYPIAYVLAIVASPRRRYALMLVALLPFLTSYLLRIYAWRLLLGKEGVFNRLLVAAGFEHSSLGFFLFTRGAVVMVLVYVWTPWAALPIFVRLEQIDVSLREAAADLGARPWRGFRRVVFPLSLSGVIAAFFFVFIPTLGDFATADLVGGTGGIMIGNLIDGLLRALSYPSGAVLAVLLLVIALVFMFIGGRFIREGVWSNGR
jgi:spermidine/putrescine transport system permease protein